MTEDTPPPAERRKVVRGRGKIFAERTTVTVRMDVYLHESMVKKCMEAQMPVNTYIVNLIRADLKDSNQLP